jgi:hypothetical protein
MWVRLLGLFLLVSSACAACSKSPDAFALLPKEAQLIAFFDAAQLRNTKLWEAFWEKSKKDDYFNAQVDSLRTFLGLDIFKDLETVSIAAWLEGTMQPQFAGVVRLSAGANAQALQAALKERSQERKDIGGASFSSYSGVWVSLLGESEVLFGTERGVERALLVQKKQAESALQNERLMTLREQAGTGQFFIVADVPAFVGAGAAFFLSQAKMPGMGNLASLASLSSVVINFNFYNGVEGSAKIRVADEAAAEALANQPLVKGLSGLGSLFFLRNMDSWLQSKAVEKDWVLQVAIPTPQATRLLSDAIFYLNESSAYTPYVPSISVEPTFHDDVNLPPTTEPSPP